ncbi:MAG: Protein of unknown function (DUF3288) [Phormidesmis priestleyi Ana]|uniref:DUF3288 domain-containing protein n=1 Tax=Phormidesmis priestleyi Ana TaxID=1666911 RepID=A0A0N8KNC7_9CYAN|nr:MAG: Protein of unknown function (DUF3288) [Phormidesmis priestleyi Ana]
MTDTPSNKDYPHPQYTKDRDTLNTILAGPADTLNMAELARLRIRYDGFPGARDIRSDLDKALDNWGITEAQLFAKTRELHKTETIFTPTWLKKGEDWS